MDIPKNGKKVLVEQETFVKKETFWVDAQLLEKLSKIHRKEKSYVIRAALRQYFGITSGKPAEPINEDEPITVEEAREIARIMRQSKKAPRP